MRYADLNALLCELGQNVIIKDPVTGQERADTVIRTADLCGDKVPSPWISVKERLPEMRQTVVCAVYGTDLIIQEDGETLADAVKRNRKHPHIELGYLEEDGWNGWEGFPMIVSPSYWMPFPDIEMPEVSE